MLCYAPITEHDARIVGYLANSLPENGSTNLLKKGQSQEASLSGSVIPLGVALADSTSY